MEVRQARGEELPELKRRLDESGGELIDLDSARVWVAVEDSRIIGMLPLRMVWQAEPLLVFPEVETQHTRRKAALSMYMAACGWLASADNRTGIRWLFGVTRARCVERWLLKLGWLEQYVGAKTFLKHVR